MVTNKKLGAGAIPCPTYWHKWSREAMVEEEIWDRKTRDRKSGESDALPKRIITERREREAATIKSKKAVTKTIKASNKTKSASRKPRPKPPKVQQQGAHSKTGSLSVVLVEEEEFI